MDSRNPSLGAAGLRGSFSPTSWVSRFSLRELQRRHAATTFSQECKPPLDFGTTWSTFSAGAPQYWHTQPSRAKTPRRVSAAWARWGTCTKYRSFTTDGAAIAKRSEWKTTPLEATTSALSLRTRRIALRTDTT